MEDAFGVLMVAVHFFGLVGGSYLILFKFRPWVGRWLDKNLP